MGTPEFQLPALTASSTTAHPPTTANSPVGPKNGHHCVATVRSTGLACKLNPGPWRTVCHKHGGSAPQIQAKAKIREIEAGARVALSKLDVEPLTNPLQALLDLGAEMVAFKDMLGTQLEQLNAADLTHFDRQGQQYVAAIANSFSQALKDAGQLLVAINKLGILERRQRLEEAEIDRITRAIFAGVRSLEAGLDDDQAERVMLAISAAWERSEP